MVWSMISRSINEVVERLIEILSRDLAVFIDLIPTLRDSMCS
jgi:hypothetical protein